jgi:hypothetical protein
MFDNDGELREMVLGWDKKHEERYEICLTELKQHKIEDKGSNYWMTL